MSLEEFIIRIPKPEVHLHIEGTLRPEDREKFAKRNNIPFPYESVEELREAYKFNKLGDFLKLYYEGCEVLIHERDFYDLTTAYLKKCYEQNIVHAEIMFDPQTHTDRGVVFDTVINGIYHAMMHAEAAYGMTTKLIMSFLRDKSEESAFKTLESAIPHLDKITAVGLDSEENGNPPSKFARVFDKARELGLKLVAHAGEEGSPEYVKEAIFQLQVERIDHGNRALEDIRVVGFLQDLELPLTVCPLSNLKLCVVDDLKNHPLKKMLEYGLKATVNSDDPAYFGGYLNENFIAIAEALNLTKEDIFTLVVNGFQGSFLDQETKDAYLQQVVEFYKQNA